ncbi:MAG: cob(I)yrinic acid a,c-diamide adenosyltransferase [Legionellales bacterium]|nr:cob(I)yrinic acid a,c-diamide adenosyltransferase [Legionellales bacterium]
MGHRLSKIYTRTGDDGSTGLGDGSRISKDDIRVQAYGTIDELNSFIGLLLTVPNLPENLAACLIEIQHDLFDIGGELCLPGTQFIPENYVTRLEKNLDAVNADLPRLKEFILPGGNTAAAYAHVARTVCRRAERELVTLNRIAPINLATLHYMNRLSDLLFVFARALARQDGGTEVLWSRQRS